MKVELLLNPSVVDETSNDLGDLQTSGRAADVEA